MLEWKCFPGCEQRAPSSSRQGHRPAAHKTRLLPALSPRRPTTGGAPQAHPQNKRRTKRAPARRVVVESVRDPKPASLSEGGGGGRGGGRTGKGRGIGIDVLRGELLGVSGHPERVVGAGACTGGGRQGPGSGGPGRRGCRIVDTLSYHPSSPRSSTKHRQWSLL